MNEFLWPSVMVEGVGFSRYACIDGFLRQCHKGGVSRRMTLDGGTKAHAESENV